MSNIILRKVLYRKQTAFCHPSPLMANVSVVLNSMYKSETAFCINKSQDDSLSHMQWSL